MAGELSVEFLAALRAAKVALHPSGNAGEESLILRAGVLVGVNLEAGQRGAEIVALELAQEIPATGRRPSPSSRGVVVHEAALGLGEVERGDRAAAGFELLGVSDQLVEEALAFEPPLLVALLVRGRRRRRR